MLKINTNMLFEKLNAKNKINDLPIAYCEKDKHTL
jgi:hypothetical protein